MTAPPRASLMGDAALLLDTDDLGPPDGGVTGKAPGLSAARLADELREADLGFVEDLVPADRSLGVLYDPDMADQAAVLDSISAVARAAARKSDRSWRGGDAARHEISVTFDGEDLEAVARAAHSSPDGVVETLCSTVFQVAWLGFMPGFAYLSGLPEALSRLDRRSRPRTRAPAGALGLAGGYAGIYPSSGPAGWNLVGRTDFRLFDPRTPPYAALRPGDEVRLVSGADTGGPGGAATGGVGASSAGPTPDRPPLSTLAERKVAIISPGLLSTVQDRGRVGVAHLGVPRAGAFDPLLARLANTAAGNAPGVAVVEITGGGIVLRSCCRCAAAVVGAELLELNGRVLEAGAVLALSPGDVLAVPAPIRGARAFLGLSGGIETPAVFGSRSMDLASGLGGGPLRAGDELALGEPGRPRGTFSLAPARRTKRLRVLAGPDTTGPGLLSEVISSTLSVGPASDRTGVQLTADPALTAHSSDVLGSGRSHAVVAGSLQLNPDGTASVLGPDHGTTGGYVSPFTVISADLGELAQLLPGDEVGLDLTDLDGAARARRVQADELARAVRGWLLPPGL